MEEKFTREVIQKIIHQELNKREKEGIEVYKQYSNKIITEKEYKNRVKVVKGYGVWCGTESSWSLKEVELNFAKKLEKGLHEISATCIMELSSARVYSFDKPPQEGIATVIMKVNDAFEVKEFNFRWKK